jgi:hypothetical protein
VVAKVRSETGEVDPSSQVSAKLMTYGDLRRAASPGEQTPATPDTLQIWAVEILGKFTPSMAPRSYPSGVLIVDARSGSTIGVIAGPQARPPYWNGLPDHSAS